MGVKETIENHPLVAMAGAVVLGASTAWTVSEEIRINPLEKRKNQDISILERQINLLSNTQQVAQQQAEGRKVNEEKQYNLLGQWRPIDINNIGCDALVFTSDNGKVIKGSCDNPAYEHKILGTYVNSSTIKSVVTRIDLGKNCSTRVEGSYVFVDDDTVKYSQEGYNGCGIKTGSGGYTLGRI